MFFLVLSLTVLFFILSPVLTSNIVIISYAVHPFDICREAPVAWQYIKIIYIISYILSSLIISNSLYSSFSKKYVKKKSILATEKNINPSSMSLYLHVGKDFENGSDVFIPEQGLYQNILITGTIGSGKTSSAMYPFTEQLIRFCKDKIGMLILDVKGNFYNQVKLYSQQYNRLDDLIIIELGNNIKYNPLDKPNLKPIVLANRLKTILTLFSTNNGESYWLEKVEQILCECIKLCRLYNNGYVTFLELHKLINNEDYYKEKLRDLRKLFQSGKMSREEVYNLTSAITFFEEEFSKLDFRTLSILKSEITRITGTFISDLDVLNTFSPEKDEITFKGFSDVINNSKIVVLNMNIAEYRNLSKILAAYLKLDFQSEILSQLSTTYSPKTTAFICDEFHEYVTSTDGDFFAQSRESKCINIVATQSYTSLLNTLKDNSTVKVIVQNLINKFWFRTDDSITIEDVQKQIGKEDKSKISRSISENANETHYSYFTNSLKSKKSSVSESINTYVQSDFVYDSNFFTQKLEVFTSLAFLSDGNRIMRPTKLKMLPYFQKIFSPPNKLDKKTFKII